MTIQSFESLPTEDDLVREAGRMARAAGLEPTGVKLVAKFVIDHGPEAYAAIRRLYAYSGMTRRWFLTSYAAAFAAGIVVALVVWGS